MKYFELNEEKRKKVDKKIAEILEREPEKSITEIDDLRNKISNSMFKLLKD